MARQSESPTVTSTFSTNGGADMSDIEKGLQLLAARRRYQESEKGKLARARAQEKQKARQREQRAELASLKSRFGAKSLEDLLSMLESQLNGGKQDPQ